MNVSIDNSGNLMKESVFIQACYQWLVL